MSVNESPPTGHEDADPPLLPAVAKTLVFGILLAAIWFTLRGRRAQDAGQHDAKHEVEHLLRPVVDAAP